LNIKSKHLFIIVTGGSIKQESMLTKLDDSTGWTVNQMSILQTVVGLFELAVRLIELQWVSIILAKATL
jgi:hypothetical protein